MTDLRVHGYVEDTVVEGPGVRAALWLQGCSIGCADCQVKHLWPRQGGTLISASVVADMLLALNHERVSILGGEPFDQLRGLFALVLFLRQRQPDIHIVIYSGYTLEQLQAGEHLSRGDNRNDGASAVSSAAFTDYILMSADVLVDGPFIKALDHDLMQFRGSANQRVIDLRATFAKRVEIGLDDAIVTIPEWDDITISVSPNGQFCAAMGVPAALGIEIENPTPARRCGQIG